MLDRPDFFARPGVVAEACPRADRDALPAAIPFDERWRPVGFAQVAVADDLAVGGGVVIVRRALGSPDVFARALVDGGDELMVDAVVRQNEQVFEDHRRRARAA